MSTRKGHHASHGQEGSKQRAQAAKAQKIENFNSLRKEKRHIQMSKRRKREEGESVDIQEQQFSEEEIKQVIEGLINAPKGKKSESLKQLRRLMSKNELIIDAIIQKYPNTINLLIESLDSGGAEERLESAWCITNIASSTSDNTKYIMTSVGHLVTLLQSPDHVLQEQCLWALANIGGDEDRSLGEFLIQNGALQPIINCLASSHISVSQCSAWALSNLIRGRQEHFEELFIDIKATSFPKSLNRFFKSNQIKNENFRLEILWLLTYISNSNDQINEKLISNGILNFIIESFDLFKNGQCSEELIIPCVRIIGNLLSSGDKSASLTSSNNTIPFYLFLCLSHSRRVVVKEACWALSNLLAGTDEEVNRIISIEGFIPKLVDLLINSDYETKREAAYCIANLCSNGRNIDLSVKSGALSGYVLLLKAPDAEIVDVSLSFIEMALQYVAGVAEILEELDITEYLGNLMYSDNFAKRAQKIMDDNFDENMVE
eukprot:c17671_g1_i1.p1 GENE.c17671_g1_i1~~c17671_g1_i1.p1  ORF type:complete len:490 (+),score=195.59 c17671_g1_i1:23-1492(+)